MGQTYLFVRLFVLTLVFKTLDAKVRLVDNGYEGLKIIIKDTVKEDPELIDKIKVSDVQLDRRSDGRPSCPLKSQ